MALFPWRDEYSVKVPSIDVQHHKWSTCSTSCTTAWSRARAVNAWPRCLADSSSTRPLTSHTRKSCSPNTAIPTRRSTPRNTKILVKQVLAFKDKYDKGRSNLNMELMMFLKNWLIQHILGSDKAYSAHLVERGAK